MRAIPLDMNIKANMDLQARDSQNRVLGHMTTDAETTARDLAQWTMELARQFRRQGVKMTDVQLWVRTPGQDGYDARVL